MRTLASSARIVGAAAVLAAVVWRLGTGPVLDGLRAVDGRALLVAGAIGLLSTVCCAWRWTVVARGLGVPLSLPAAAAAYYRSTFLNLTLPGGVVGDVHRGVRHGHDVHDLGRALRAVVWERGAGQFVQAVLTIAVLVVLPSPARPLLPLLALVLAGSIVVLALLGRTSLARRSRLSRVRAGAAADIRLGLLRRGAAPAIVLASAAVVLGHAATFVVAARAAGVTAPLPQLAPLALLALLGMVLPGIAGWGPREGVTAWVFAAAGLGADRGVATAVAYGVLALAAGLPGAFILLADWFPRRLRVRVGTKRVAGA